MKKALLVLGVALAIAAVVVYMLGGKKWQVRYDQTIQAPKNVVFEHLVNPELVQLWASGISDFEQIEGQPGEEESSSKMQVTIGQQDVEMTDTIRMVSLDERLLVSSQCYLFTANTDFRLESTGEQTELRFVLEYQYNGVFRFIAPFIEHPLRRKSESDVLRLRQIVEQNYADMKSSSMARGGSVGTGIGNPESGTTGQNETGDEPINGRRR